ncbi:hypothetical protein BV25DRAFT_1840670 [Artomyces pyxidatus]|uniref:Uncharacterized protein n=1 Tax=Artomyces pyxidatus TaxID=48021 RepID=A0ACB8SS37_9AGAM|nr:hypothetical protein BV25DRAFT_1840670 [Artomyces pyxidatus]
MDPMLFLDLEAATDGGDDNNDQPDELDADFIDDAESSGALQCRSLSLFPKLEKDLDEGDSDEDLDSDEELADVVQRARRRARDANRVATSHGSDLRRAILDLTRRHQMDRDTTHPNEVLGKVRPPPGPSQANSRDSRLATLSEARGPLQFDDADAVLFAIRVPLTAAHQARHAKEVCETLNYRIGVAPYSQSRRVIWPDILAAERYDAAASFIYIRAQSWRAASRVIARTPHLSARRQAPLLVDENSIPPPLVASELTQDFHRGRACRVTSGPSRRVTECGWSLSEHLRRDLYKYSPEDVQLEDWTLLRPRDGPLPYSAWIEIEAGVGPFCMDGTGRTSVLEVKFIDFSSDVSHAGILREWLSDSDKNVSPTRRKLLKAVDQGNETLEHPCCHPPKL